MSESKYIITPKFRISFPALFEPRPMYNPSGAPDPNAKKYYSLVALFPPGTDFTEMDNLWLDACRQTFGEDKKKWPGQSANLPAHSQFKKPLRKMEEKAPEGVFPPGYEAGGKFCTIKSVNPPHVVNQRVFPITDPKEIYSGCWCVAYVNAYAYPQPGTKTPGCGAAFGLQMVQKVKDDEPLMGRLNPQAVFTPITHDDTNGVGTIVAEEDAESFFTT